MVVSPACAKSSGTATNTAKVAQSSAQIPKCVGKQLLNHLLWEPELVNPALSLIKPSDGHGSTAHVIGEYEECRDVLAGEVCFVNKLLRIEADNGTVVYRIKRYLSEGGGVWEATLAD